MGIPKKMWGLQRCCSANGARDYKTSILPIFRETNRAMALPRIDHKQTPDIVIPDCCNAGVILRVLAGVNLTVVIAMLMHDLPRLTGLSAFVDASTLIELACFVSLLTLCAVRRHALPWPMYLQRAMCALVPALSTLVLWRVEQRFEWMFGGIAQPSLLGSMLVAALYGAFFQHYFELRAKAFSPALGEAQLQVLQARIRPHFLFNSLNAVLSLIRSEPRRAEAALEDLADLFRVLMRDARSLTSLYDELHLCRQYLSIEKIRIGDRLDVEWDTSAIHDDVLKLAQVPSLLLQPLLENAVYHGVEQRSEPAKIRIIVRRARDEIHITISNPYQRQESVSTGNHMALDNIRRRLVLLYDVEAEMKTVIANGCFEVRLVIPYVKGAR